MSLKTLILPPVGDLASLTQLLRDFNRSVSQKYISAIDTGTKGQDAGKNLLVLDDARTETGVPVVRAYPSTIGEEELATDVAALQVDEKLSLRSYGSIQLGTAKSWVVLLDAPAARPEPPAPAIPPSFEKTKKKLPDRGIPPDDFLAVLLTWGKAAPPEIFEERPEPEDETDIYTWVKPQLGAYYGDLAHRKACMLEVLRVLAGFESSWGWKCGRDTKNTPVTAPRNEWEAGAFQVSSNSIVFGADLKALILREVKTTDAETFRQAMMNNHSLAIEYSARLLRHTIRHHGPVKRREIHDSLSTAAVEEWHSLLTA